MANTSDKQRSGVALPPFAPIPPSTIRLSLAPEEWQACLDAWLLLAELNLRLPPTQFKQSLTNRLALPSFLQSFYSELASLAKTDYSFSDDKARQLQKTCFMLTRRAMLDTDLLHDLGWVFLSNFCHAHLRSTALAQLMNSLWKQKQNNVAAIFQELKSTVTEQLESSAPGAAEVELARLAPIMRASADVGAFFMTGSDFLDALTSAYGKTTAVEERRAATSIAYLGLISLTKTEATNASMLSDHLYSLKAQADQRRNEASLLADVVTNSPLIAKLRRTVSGNERLNKLIDVLETYRMPSIARPRPRRRQKTPKGKGKQSQSQANGELHMHRMSLVTQIQDLFPELGSGFILRLLDEYGDNVEQVTAHLLDDSLPPHLQSMDRSEQAPIYDQGAQQEVEHLAPRSTPPLEPFVPERRNVFDDDEFDRLEADAARLHFGKRDYNPSKDQQPNKAAILSALAAFDSDDDERDDTYDVEDVGGTVDTAHPDGEPGPSAKVTQEENDMALFTAYKSSPDLFDRTFNTRRGQARMALKAETGMTDEAIEGWAIMLQRDPRRLKKLEERFGASAFDGKQPELASTAYRESQPGTETEDSDVPGSQGANRGSLRGRGRGRGRGGRGRGGNVAGPSNDASTAAAQKRKEANKSSRANHNRRDQRAKKMARGGFSG